MSAKKIVIPVVSSVAGVGVIVGAVFGGRAIQKSRQVAQVVPVMNINQYYGNDSTLTSEGTVVNDAAQNIYVGSDQIVKTVYVSEGDEVKEGDPLVEFDVTSLELSVEVKELEVQTLKNKYETAQKELERLKTITPVEKSSDSTEDSTEDTTEEDSENLPDKKNANGCFQYLDETDVAASALAGLSGSGTKDDPYILLCQPDCFALGSFFNAVKASKISVTMQVMDKGKVSTTWTIDGESLSTYDEESRWGVVSRSQVEEDYSDEGNGEENEGEGSGEEAESETLVTEYTAEELNKAIAKQQQEIKDYDLSVRKAELELKDMQGSLEDGIVYAKMDGTVLSAGDPENIPNDGSAFLVLAGKEGMYVKGDVSELSLDSIQVGQEVIASSWETGLTYTGTITEIDEYPDPNSYAYGDGNPNVSYYAYTAHIDDTAGLESGQYLELSIMSSTEEDTGSQISIEPMYVREEDGKSYVYIDDNGKLKKQYVTTGKVEWGGYAVEITSGLSLDDKIAFPYGKAAKEGVRTEEVEYLDN